MPNSIWGTPVLPAYTGITAQEGEQDAEEAQRLAEQQREDSAANIQAGFGPQPSPAALSPLGQVIGGIRSLFGHHPGAAPATAGTGLPPDAAATPGSLLATRGAPPAAAAVAPAPPGDGYSADGDGGSLWGPTRDTVVAAQSAGPNANLARRPSAGEFVPQVGRFATTADGTAYDQAKAQALAGVAPTPGSLMATRSPSVGAAAQQAGVPGAYQMPPVTITASRPAVATVPPGGTPATPNGASPGAGQPAAAVGAPALVLPNAAAQAQGLYITPDQVRQMAPPVSRFLADNGVQRLVSSPGLGTFDRAVGLLPKAYEALANANQAAAVQNAETGRLGISESGEDVRTLFQGANQQQIETMRTAAAALTSDKEINAAWQRALLDQSTMRAHLALESQELAASMQRFGVGIDTKALADATGPQSPIGQAESQARAIQNALDAVRISATNPSMTNAANLQTFMAQVAMGSPQLRAQLIELAGPAVGGESLDQRFARGVQELASGTRPASQTASIIASLQSQRAALAKQYDGLIAAAVAAHPYSQGLQTVLEARKANAFAGYGEAMGATGVGAAAGGNGGNATPAVGKVTYTPDNPFAKTAP